MAGPFDHDPEEPSSAAREVRRRVKVRVRTRRKTGSHKVIPKHTKARRRVKLALLTAFAIGIALGVSWCAAGRYAGDPTVPRVQELPPQ